jgi:hypothetical protein
MEERQTLKLPSHGRTNGHLPQAQNQYFQAARSTAISDSDKIKHSSLSPLSLPPLSWLLCYDLVSESTSPQID